MIVRVWGTVNSAEVEFAPVKGRPDYWEGLAPQVPGLQDIEIWAENDKGARGHLQCQVLVEYHTHTMARLLILPYVVQLLERWKVRELPPKYETTLESVRRCAG